ncbi:MAG: thioester reductase domain-containing protein [Prochlorothrix sp.]
MTPNLPQEAQLDSAIQFNQPLAPTAHHPQNILLTGATGFLGAFLLETLLKQTQARIYCLIRGQNPAAGRQRLIEHLSFYKLWQPKWGDRIVPLMGDLRQPHLGLGAATWDTLTQTIDTLYHGAAMVNSAVSYEILKPINVLGTQEVLRLASIHHTKPLHFVSTMAVFLNPQQPLDQTVLETTIPPWEGLKGGYKQSKWVAESLVREAQKRGLPACIHRPARIMGDSRTGITGNLTDFLCSLLKGCILFGKTPQSEAVINLMPVDYVAQAIVHLAQGTLKATDPSQIDPSQTNPGQTNPGQAKTQPIAQLPWGKTFNLMNPKFIPWDTLSSQIRALGYKLEPVSHGDWMAELQKRVSDPSLDPSHTELYGSLLLLLTSPLNLFAPKPPISLANTTAGLVGSGITCPPVDQSLTTQYLTYFQNSGYLPTVAQQFDTPAITKPPSPDPPKKAPSAFWKGIRSTKRSNQTAFKITPVDRSQPLPLSFGQERLWFIEQLQPGLPVHNLRGVFRLRGALDIDCLGRSLREIVRRQEVLRTSFPAVKGQPTVKIWPEVDLPLPVESLAHLTPEEQNRAIARIAAEAAQEPFDLSQAPLMRVKLLRLSDTDHALVRTVHHIINDVWTDTVRLRELAALYTAFSRGEPSPLPELKVQYVDFATAQRQWLQGEVLQTQIDYWKTQLSPPLRLLRLPTDHKPDAAPTYNGAAIVVSLPPALTTALKTITQEAGVTLFTTLLAAYKILLNRYTGQEDLILCSPVASRKQPATKKLLGYFSNIVLIRTQIQENLSFREIIKRVSQSVLGAFDHNDLPFQQLVDDLRIPGAFLSRAMFTLQNVPPQPKELAPGIALNLQEMEEGISNFDLSLSLKEKDEGLVGIFRYKTDLFEEGTVATLGENLEHLLTTLVSHPDRPLGDLPQYAPWDGSANLEPECPSIPYVAPETESQRSIVAIWQNVLKLDRIGIDDNFFDIGGRSLAMIQVYVQLKALLPLATQDQLAVPELFKRPTVRGMAEYFDRLT